MERVLSTYLYAEKPLTLGLLAEIAGAGIPAIELFCVPYHFDYRSAQKVRDLADWLGEHRLKVHALHSPMERDVQSGKRDSGMPISISDPERLRRLDAVDEVKRALEVAESIPFRFLVQHLDSGKRMSDQRRSGCGVQFAGAPGDIREAARRGDCPGKYAGRFDLAFQPAAIHRGYAAE